jgi:hypothetical protein
LRGEKFTVAELYTLLGNRKEIAKFLMAMGFAKRIGDMKE